jgi:hypothetical protein
VAKKNLLMVITPVCSTSGVSSVSSGFPYAITAHTQRTIEHGYRTPNDSLSAGSLVLILYRINLLEPLWLPLQQPCVSDCKNLRGAVNTTSPAPPGLWYIPFPYAGRGMTFEVFLPQRIADWLREQLNAGVFKDPGEAPS